MKLYNQTQGKVIASNVIVANTFFKRLKGLLGKKGLEEGSCILINPCNSIHTFFMKFPIDVLFLDQQYKVVKVVKDLAPGRMSPYMKDARFVVELDSRKVHKENVKVGDQLVLKDMNKANILKC